MLREESARVSRAQHRGEGGTCASGATAIHQARSAAAGASAARDELTRAEERALRRSEPLTSAQFKELRRLAEQGVSPLRHI